jgi:molecular chaperone GrpE
MKPPSTDEEPVIDSLNPSASPTDSAGADAAIFQKKLASKNDEYLRLAADFDNFKKRTRRDSEQKAAAEKESFILDLLPVVDNLERALACKPSPSSQPLRQGVEMTLEQLNRLLQSNGIGNVEAVGRPFDPHRHEAVSMRHDPAQPDHVVLEVTQRGYCHGEKLFRPARVIVNDPGHSPGAGRAR